MADFILDRDIKVGTGATEYCGSDSYAYSVVDWKRNRKGEVVEVTVVEPDLEGGGFGERAYAKPFDSSWLSRPRYTFKRTRKSHDVFTTSGTWQGYRFGLRVRDISVSYEDPSF